ncbi:MAG: hypothetical protein JWR80_1127 [Bradyrhizobium sp.]|nr:hypothetical protein [Bradyrhizobium sp.]
MRAGATPAAPDAEVREKEWLREYIAAFEKGQFKLPTPEQLAAADAALNLAYQRVMALPGDSGHPDRLSWSTVEKKDVRTTQRAWLAYRDAWLRFASQRYPSMPPASLAAALTERRTRQLTMWGG